jgi:hypothetical protein
MKSIFSCLAIAIACSLSASAQPSTARIAYELACPSGYSPVASFGKSFNSITGMWRANVCVSDMGDGTMVCQMQGCSSASQLTIAGTGTASGSGSLASSFASVPSGTPRNNFTASLGFTFSVSSVIAVSQFGRLYLSGNTQDHRINLWVTSNINTPIATGTVLAASVSDGNGFKWVSINPVTLTPGNTYVIAVDETSGGDTWYNAFVPSLQAVFSTALSAYTTLIDTFPYNNASGAGTFSTPAMMYTPDTAVTNFPSGTLLATGSYWNGQAPALDSWSVQDISGTASNPSRTLTFSNSGSSGFPSVSVPNLSTSQITNSISGVGALATPGQIDPINANNILGNSAGVGTLTGVPAFSTTLVDIAGTVGNPNPNAPVLSGTVNTSGTAVTWVSGVQFPTVPGQWKGQTIFINGVANSVVSVTSATSLTLNTSAGTQTGVPYTYPLGDGGGRTIASVVAVGQQSAPVTSQAATGFPALKVANFIPSSSTNAAYYFSAVQGSVDNWGSGNALETSGVRGFANNLGTSTETYLLGVDGEAYQYAQSGVSAIVSGGYFFATDPSAAAGASTALYGLYSFASHSSTGVTLASEDGGYFKSGGTLGTVTNDYGIYIDSPATGATLTNHYGLYIADQTAGGANNPSPFAINVAGGNSNLGPGQTTVGTLKTATNCAGVGTSASPSVASCGSASAGHFSCATTATGATCTVNTTAVTASSEIFVSESDTAATGTALGVTCNTSTNVLPASRLLASSVAATSFTINLGTVTTNPACFAYHIVN